MRATGSITFAYDTPGRLLPLIALCHRGLLARYSLGCSLGGGFLWRGRWPGQCGGDSEGGRVAGGQGRAARLKGAQSAE